MAGKAACPETANTATSHGREENAKGHNVAQTDVRQDTEQAQVVTGSRHGEDGSFPRSRASAQPATVSREALISSFTCLMATDFCFAWNKMRIETYELSLHLEHQSVKSFIRHIQWLHHSKIANTYCILSLCVYVACNKGLFMLSAWPEPRCTPVIYMYIWLPAWKFGCQRNCFSMRAFNMWDAGVLFPGNRNGLFQVAKRKWLIYVNSHHICQLAHEYVGRLNVCVLLT